VKGGMSEQGCKGSAGGSTGDQKGCSGAFAWAGWASGQDETGMLVRGCAGIVCGRTGPRWWGMGAWGTSARRSRVGTEFRRGAARRHGVGMEWESGGDPLCGRNTGGGGIGATWGGNRTGVGSARLCGGDDVSLLDVGQKASAVQRVAEAGVTAVKQVLA
jgi:hypothetical protein